MFIDFIRKNINIIAILLFAISICILYFIDQYNIFGTILLNIAIMIFVSSFFVKHIEKSERDFLYNKLQDFQKETAKDAIKATFERIIDSDLFSIIKQDILSTNFIRSNAHWDFDIYKKNKKLVLKRTLTYNLKNITTVNQKEIFFISSNNNIHAKTIIKECKYKNEHEHEYIDIKFGNIDFSKSIMKAKDEIEVKANSEVQVIIIFEEFFSQNYIYESHSTRFPIIGLNLTVNHPQEYEFEIIVQTFSNELKLTSSTDGKKKFETKKAIYKGQGIEFLCYKKNLIEAENLI